MRGVVILYYLGLMQFVNALFMLLSAGVAYFNDVDSSFFPLALSAFYTILISIFLMLFSDKDNSLNPKEGYVIVASTWLLSGFTGMLPLVLWGGEYSFINGWFESISGFTTTGATILSDVEKLPAGLLFWRSSMHWIGGVGVILFTLLLIPSAGKSKSVLSNLEVSSLAKTGFSNYRSKNMVRIILLVYVIMTLLLTILLLFGGMSFSDAVNHAFSTISTGGFSTKNLSIGYFNSIYIDTVITVFMLLAGVHFGLIFATFFGAKRNIFKSDVVKYYLYSTLIGGVIISLNLYFSFESYDFFTALRHAMFQISSIASTTGFAVADTSVWPDLSILLIIFFSIQCACSGSTAGGVKADRILIFMKTLKAKVLQQQHPNAIIPVKINGEVLTNNQIHIALSFILIYIALLFVSTILVSFTGESIMTSFSSSMACLGCVGPGFEKVGSLGNYSELHWFAKIVLSIAMLIGRLEIFSLVHLILLRSWR